MRTGEYQANTEMRKICGKREHQYAAQSNLILCFSRRTNSWNVCQHFSSFHATWVFFLDLEENH